MALTPFSERVYALAARIPRGRVATYGQLAALAGKPLAARAVGAAMQAIPENVAQKVPAHRVIRSDGTLAPVHVFGHRQRERLQGEGVGFTPGGRVDVDRFLWRPRSGT
jgi:methylated-DNA-protein-cysteine methyltransferase-like protein